MASSTASKPLPTESMPCPSAELDDVGRAELGQQVRAARGQPVAHRRHLHALGAEQLHGRRADPTGGPVDQCPVTRAQAGHAEEGMGVVGPLHARRRVGQIPSLGHPGDQPVDGDGDQLGMGAGPAVDEAEHPVTDGVRRDALADADHDAGVLRPQHVDPGPWPPAEGPVDPGLPGPVRAVGAVDGGRVHPHQDLARAGDRLGDVVEADDRRAAVPRPDRCAHRPSMTPPGRPASRAVRAAAPGPRRRGAPRRRRRRRAG